MGTEEILTYEGYKNLKENLNPQDFYGAIIAWSVIVVKKISERTKEMGYGLLAFNGDLNAMSEFICVEMLQRGWCKEIIDFTLGSIKQNKS